MASLSYLPSVFRNYFMGLKVCFIHVCKTVACIVVFYERQSLLHRYVFESLDFSEPISKFIYWCFYGYTAEVSLQEWWLVTLGHLWENQWLYPKVTDLHKYLSYTSFMLINKVQESRNLYIAKIKIRFIGWWHVRKGVLGALANIFK